MPEESAESRSPEREPVDLIIPPTMVRRGKTKERPTGNNREAKRVGLRGYAALIVLTLLVFAPILKSDFLWSAYDSVERTPYTSMTHWTEAWSVETVRQNNPVALATYFIESYLPLAKPAAHRLLNLSLHLLAALLLLKVLEGLKLPGAYAAALVFALHPAALQTLFWPGYRNELVGLVFILATLFFGIRHRDSKDFTLALLLTLVSSLLHPAALVIPFILGLCAFYQNKSFHLYHYNRILPLFCIALFVGVWTHSGQVAQPATEEISTFVKAGQNLYFYLQQTFLSFDHSLFHPFSAKQSYNVGAANSLLAFVIFIPFYVLIGLNCRQHWAKGLLLGLSSFLLLLLYGIFQTGRFIDGSLAKEEHALYLALPAAVAVVFCGTAGFFRQKKVFGRYLWRIFFGLFLMVQIGLTASYSFAVSDTPRMWQSMAERWENSWQPKAALIDSVRSGKSDLLSKSEMIRTLEEILEINPERDKERILLARSYRESGQQTNALREYRQILRETEPGDAFLKEAADFFDSLNLRWEADNARERINAASNAQ